MLDDDINDLLSDKFQFQFVCNEIHVHAKPKFQPPYLKTNGKCENDKERLNALNAAIEIISLWKYVETEALYNYSSIYSKLSFPLSDKLKLSCQSNKEKFAVYDRKSNAWLTPCEPKYNYCYDGKRFVDLMEAKYTQTGNRFLLMGKYTTIMQEPKLLAAVADAPGFSTFVMPRMELTVGVPGCGKTNHILNNHTPGSLVLTSGKEGAQDIRTRMAEKFGGEPCNYSRSYRTIDSYLLNSRDLYSYVWVDEALMEHPGKLFLVCLLSRCQKLYMLGDPNQLGYINRTDVSLLYDKSSMFFKPTAAGSLNVSYRCPVDVMAHLCNNYDYDGAYSASNVLRSLKSETFTSLKDVPKSERKKYLVFKQAEKKRMKEAGYDVSTVHEYQGKEAKRVVLVRMSCNLGESLYESAPHILVAMSRHRKSLTYYTPVSDKLKKLIDVPFTDAELQKYKNMPTENSASKTTNTDSDEAHIKDLLQLPVLHTTQSLYNNACIGQTAACPLVTNSDQTNRERTTTQQLTTNTLVMYFIVYCVYGLVIACIFSQTERFLRSCMCSFAFCICIYVMIVIKRMCSDN